MTDTEIDYSEVIGKLVECPPQCGMCCLCQPEVLPEERNFFRSKHSKSLVKVDDGRFALSMKQGRGSCVFLNGRRCSIYANRPTFCRQYPFHFHVSDRVRVELNLSCRGVWSAAGTDAVSEAKALADASSRRIESALKEASSVYREFYSICRETGVINDPSMLRMTVSENIAAFTDMTYLAKIMDLSLEEPKMSLAGITPDPKYDKGEMEKAARDAALASMSSDDPMNVPVYCGKDWSWNIFMVNGNTLEWAVLDDDGNLFHKAFADPSEIPLKPLEEGGAEVLAQYISVLNGRDSFLGSVFHTMDELGYDDDMGNAYYGALAVSVIDLLWRASMLDHFFGTGMGADGIREAIIFYDMDRLDAPTIGAFV